MLSLLALPFALLAAPSPQAAERPVDFERDIRPILAARCVECHGEKKHKAGLRLDVRKDALAGAQFGAEPVIVPGRAAESVLYRRTHRRAAFDNHPAR